MNGISPQHSRQKRITILTYGSRGDVEPFVALGLGLIKAGHAVRLAGPAPFAAFIETHGLEFAPIAGNPDELAQIFADRAGMSWPRMIEGMIQHTLPLAKAAFPVLQRASSDADLIIHSFLMTDAGHTLACRRGIPDVSAQFFPIFLSTSAFPAVALPDLPLGGVYRRGTHALNTGLFRYGSRLLYSVLRASSPELPTLAPWIFQKPVRQATSILFAYSSYLLPRPPEWPSYAHVTGYWQLPPAPGWTPPVELDRFLESGPAPVYFGPGSMQGEQLHSILRSVISAVRACGQRVMLGVSPDRVRGDLQGTDVFAVQTVPHAWLFPRMRYILHHGGAGTTGAAAAAGVPSTAIPFSADQAFWARRIHKLGLGPAAPDARHLNRERLERVLTEAANPVYQRRAKALADSLCAEDGVASAIQIIHRQLGI